MLLSVATIILPLFFITLLGVLFILVPQKEAACSLRASQRTIRPGCKVQTTTGLQGFVLTSTNTHVIITAMDGQKHEFLKHLVSPHETGI